MLVTFNCEPTPKSNVTVRVMADYTHVLGGGVPPYVVSVSRDWKDRWSRRCRMAILNIPVRCHDRAVYQMVARIIAADRELRVLPCDRVVAGKRFAAPVLCGECPNCVRRQGGQDVMVLGALADLIDENGLEGGTCSGDLGWLLEQLRVCAGTKQLAVR